MSNTGRLDEQKTMEPAHEWYGDDMTNCKQNKILHFQKGKAKE